MDPNVAGTPHAVTHVILHGAGQMQALTESIKVAGALIGGGAGVGGAGAGVGAIGGSMCEATARQPELINVIRVQFFLAAAIIEGFTFLLLVLVMIVLIKNGGF
jgi:F-type H+-transporting ATPase subunit c